MNSLILNIVFACFWLALTGAFTLPNLLFGLGLGAFSLFLFRGSVPSAKKTKYNLAGVFALLVLFVFELIKSAIAVAILVLRPNMRLKSGIFAYETKLTKDSNITLLANLITLTPGTLTVEISENRQSLYIHALDCSDIEATSIGIRDGFERRITEAFGDHV